MPKTRQSWLLLIHQLPPKPDSFRVKIWRLIQKTGALVVKNSVYALPENENSLNALTRLAKVIREGGGEAIIANGQILEGFDAEKAIRKYNQSIDTEFQKWTRELQKIEGLFSKKKSLSADNLMEVVHELGRIESELNSLSPRNHFDSEGETIARSHLKRLQAKIEFLSKNSESRRKDSRRLSKHDYSGSTWVTRKGPKVDRLASAWVIRREIDPKAEFRFESMDSYKHKRGDQRFDVFGGEFTHEGELCTFEVLLAKFGLTDPKLRKIGEIIHDLDIGDGKYQHPETEGIKQLLSGIIRMERVDSVRMERACVLFEQLYGSF